MTQITPERKYAHVEEYDYLSGISERSYQKMGGVQNWILERENKAYDFMFNGVFRPLNGGEDGKRGMIWDTEIVGVTGSLDITGVANTTVVDLHLIRAGIDLGSIWSTKLQIANFATDGVTFGKNYPAASESSPTGITLPVFTTYNLNAFDQLRVDLDANAELACQLSLNIHYRPR